MKKILVTMLSLVLLAGCSTAAPKQEKKVYKMGVASTSSIKSKEATAEGNGSASFNTTVAGIVLDDQNVIQYLSLDVIQSKGLFNTSGEVKESNYISKKEIGDKYGMKDKSPIKKEWYEQIEGFEKWAVGKKLEDVLGMELEVKDEHHKVTKDADLLTTTTIGVDGFLKTIQMASEATVEVENVKRASLTIYPTMEQKDATVDAMGKVQSNVSYGLTVVSEDDKISGMLTDVSQQVVNFTNEGKAEEAKVAMTKVEKGDEYGMKKASSLKKEWYEQNAGFAQWAKGKTLEAVLSMETEEMDNHHTVTKDADLLTTTTIDVSGYINMLKGAESKLTEIGQ